MCVCVCVCVLSMGWLGWFFFGVGVCLLLHVTGLFSISRSRSRSNCYPTQCGGTTNDHLSAKRQEIFLCQIVLTLHFTIFFKIPRSSPNRLLKGNKKTSSIDHSYRSGERRNVRVWVWVCVCVCVEASGKNDNDNDNDDYNNNSNVDRSARIITAVSFLWRMMSWHVFDGPPGSIYAMRRHRD